MNGRRPDNRSQEQITERKIRTYRNELGTLTRESGEEAKERLEARRRAFYSEQEGGG